jgi:hypothetical protein
MIQTSTFNILIAVGIVLMLYSVIDDRNRIYANLVKAYASGLILAYADCSARCVCKGMHRLGIS